MVKTLDLLNVKRINIIWLISDEEDKLDPKSSPFRNANERLNSALLNQSLRQSLITKYGAINSIRNALEKLFDPQKFPTFDVGCQFKATTDLSRVGRHQKNVVSSKNFAIACKSILDIG